MRSEFLYVKLSMRCSMTQRKEKHGTQREGVTISARFYLPTMSYFRAFVLQRMSFVTVLSLISQKLFEVSILVDEVAYYIGMF